MVKVTFAYQWISNDGSTDTDIEGETNSTYVIKPWDLGKYIKVRVSFADDADFIETLTSSATTAVEASPNIAATGSPRIAGMAEVGQSLIVGRWGVIINVQDENGMRYATLSYQWVRNDGTNDADIPDATGSSYTLTDADQGKTVKVRVSFTDDGANPEEVTSRATTAVTARPSRSDLGAPTALTTRWSVPGEDKGYVLEWRAPEGTVTGYQVLRTETPTIVNWWEPMPHGCVSFQVVHADDTGSDATTYTDTDVAEGASYSYRVRAINSDGVGRESRSSGSQYRPHGWWPSGAPGSPRAPGNLASSRVNDGVELTWDAPRREAWETSGEVTGYQILRRSPEDCEFGYRVYVENTNTTDTSWVDTDVIPGTLYEYHVRAINDHGAGYLERSRPTSIRPAERIGRGQPNSPATGVPTITGTVQVGETLTAGTSGIADRDGLYGARFFYQWLSGEDTEIEGATHTTYTLVTADESKTIKVRVNFTDYNLNQEVLTSSATTEVTAGSETTQTSTEDTSAPSAPTALSSRWTVQGEPDGMVLNWTAPQGSVTGYQVLRTETPTIVHWWEPLPHDGCVPFQVVHVEDTGSDATTYTDTDVAEGVTYTYRVRAINSNGVGPQSNSTSMQYRPHAWWPSGVWGSPRAPSNLEGTIKRDGTEFKSTELTWEAPDGDVTGYQILRRSGSPEACEYGYRVYVENTNSTDTSWTDTNVEIGTLYEYHVRAINDNGVGYLNISDSARVRPTRAVLGMMIADSDWIITPGSRNVMTVAINHLKLDDDPDTVDYTLRGDVTLDADGSDADACEGDGLGEDLEFTVVDEVAEHFQATFGGFGCNAGTFTLTFVLKDRDGQEVATFAFPKEVEGGDDAIGRWLSFFTGMPVVTGTA